MYLSSIQQGIQAAHVTHELFLKYTDFGDPSKPAVKLYEWANEHKTMVLLNGGYAANLQELIWMFMSKENPYPWAEFEEEMDSLNGALTSVGIILPEKIYETAKAIREGSIAAAQIPVRGEWSPEEGVTWELSKWEYELCLELNKYGMAS
jgi:hypothetical protein